MILKINDQEVMIKNANSFYKKLKGLMGQKAFNYGMLFKHTNSIHTFFMKENIDVLGLNKDNVVIFKALNIPKNKIIQINAPIKNTSVLELPSNTSKDIKIGQKLTFIGK